MDVLTGKVAVVTGASKGIGAGIARAFADEGASVVINYVSGKEAADTLVADIEGSGGKAVAIAANVSKVDDLARLFDQTKRQFGKVDMLVNNAGIFSFAALEQVEVKDIEAMFAANVTGLLLASRAALAHFPAQGGSIINIGSYVATQMPPQTVVYAATKGAVHTITGVLANELGPRNIRVNAILPGVVDTEGFRASGAEGSDTIRQLVKQTPLGRIGKPADVASVAVFLASDASRWVTGELIHVSGGLR